MHVRLWLSLTILLCSFAQSQTISELKERAQAGDADAMMHTVAIRYWLGEEVKQDYAESLHWLKLAAAKGNDESMKDLGIMYENGLGVTRNYEESMRWRLLSAEKGNNAAMFGVAFMYADGLGVKQDDVEAMRWFRKAADAGNDYWYSKAANAMPNDSSVRDSLIRLRKRGVRPAKSGDL
jgi:TPR repeat protein